VASLAVASECIAGQPSLGFGKRGNFHPAASHKHVEIVQSFLTMAAQQSYCRFKRAACRESADRAVFDRVGNPLGFRFSKQNCEYG